jgi:hypothetical protein
MGAVILPRVIRKIKMADKLPAIFYKALDGHSG